MCMFSQFLELTSNCLDARTVLISATLVYHLHLVLSTLFYNFFYFFSTFFLHLNVHAVTLSAPSPFLATFFTFLPQFLKNKTQSTGNFFVRYMPIYQMIYPFPMYLYIDKKTDVHVHICSFLTYMVEGSSICFCCL